MRYEYFDTPYECPCCRYLVQYMYECPGFGDMVCVPPCGGAIEFTCPICDWWYREPNNRDTTKMGRCPEWLAQAMREYFYQESYDGDEEEEEPFQAFSIQPVPLDCEQCGP